MNEPQQDNQKETYALPVVTALIERENEHGQLEILIQERAKPQKDPVYSGCTELPTGKIQAFENVYDALVREVYEETGLDVIDIYPDQRTDIFRPQGDDAAFAFQPFCCHQQTKKGEPWIGFAFICKVDPKGKPRAEEGSTRNPRWITLDKLAKQLTEQPQSFFTMHLGNLQLYLAMRGAL